MNSTIEIVAKAAVKVKLACMSVAIATLMFCPAVLGQVEVTVGDVDVTDTRGNTFNSELEIDLKLFGDMLVDAKAIRVTVDQAVDETGQSLIKGEYENLFVGMFENRFKEIRWLGENTTEIRLELKKPTRQARTIKEISGTLEIFVPNKDIKSNVTIENFLEKTNAPISNSVLKSLGIEVEVLIKKPDETAQDLYSISESVILEIKDPDSKLVRIQFLEENAKVFSPYGLGWSSTLEVQTLTFDFKEKLPSKAQLNLYVLTPNSVVTVPFKVVDIPLP